MRNAKKKQRTMTNTISKIKLLIIAVALTTVTNTFGQSQVDIMQKPYIEVTGYASKEVIPDQIYITIIIHEMYINKEKVTVESQEEKLKTYLKDIGVDINNLYLSDATADYVKVKWWTKDVLTNKDYTLKVSNATIVGQVFQQLDKLNITDAYISKVNHSKLDSLKSEVKILAIKAAKNKADYLLSAIGEQTGKPLIVREIENTTQTPGVYSQTRGSRSSYFIDGQKVVGSDKLDDLEFKKINIEAYIYVKFEIK